MDEYGAFVLSACPQAAALGCSEHDHPSNLLIVL